MVSQRKQVSGWGPQKQEISACPWQLGKGFTLFYKFRNSGQFKKNHDFCVAWTLHLREWKHRHHIARLEHMRQRCRQRIGGRPSPLTKKSWRRICDIIRSFEKFQLKRNVSHPKSNKGEHFQTFDNVLCIFFQLLYGHTLVGLILCYMYVCKYLGR